VLPTCVASSGSHEKMRFTLGLTDPVVVYSLGRAD
jgi:hypothetical protein